MISYIKGKIIKKEAPFVEIECNGFGFSFLTSLNTISNIGEVGSETKIYTHIVIKDEFAQGYCFATEIERELFRELIKIPGIGPKTAIGLLSNLTTYEFVNAISEEKTSELTKLPGIGRKTAERIVLEFREKNQRFLAMLGANEGLSKVNLLEEAVLALNVLGYPENRSRNIVAMVIKDFIGENITLEKLIKESLKKLNK